MNLTTFVTLKDVREKLRETFPKPDFSRKAEILAEPQTKNYGTIGTAFDYLLRFYIEANNPQSKVISVPWVAENSLSLLRNAQNKELYNQAEETLYSAKVLYLEYLDSKIVSNELLEASINLAKLDLVYRIGYIEPISPPDPKDVKDLTNLMNAIPLNSFNVEKAGILNPTFGVGSRLVGGADCDIYIDGNLIDIKTSKQCKFERGYFNQLIGYYSLAQYGDISGLNYEINNISIYFSRYGLLGTYPIEVITDAPNYKETYDWFIKKAKSINIQRIKQ